jgi:hypothetical protein
MLFGWSFPKLMVIAVAAFFLVIWPIATVIVLRRGRQKRKPDHD